MAALVLEWGGKQYTVPNTRVIRLGADLEDMLSTDSMNAWTRFQRPGRINANLLAMAYGYALRAAGAVVTDEEVRTAMFHGDEQERQMALAIAGLQAIMAPPAPLASKVAPIKGKRQAKAKGKR